MCLGLLLFAYLIGSIDWRGEAPTDAPLRTVLRGGGNLSVGGARVDITPSAPQALGGFVRRGNKAFTKIHDRVFVHALVLSSDQSKLGLLSMDLVLIPDILSRKIERAAKAEGLDAVIVGATHNHSGPGGYWDNLLAHFGGLGKYDAAYERRLIDASVSALREALASSRAAEIYEAESQLPGLCRSRISGRAADQRVNLITFRETSPDAADAPATNLPAQGSDQTQSPAEAALRREPRRGVLARLVVFACHPTLLGDKELTLSAGWPGSFAAGFEQSTLLFQGAVGDVSHAGVRFFDQAPTHTKASSKENFAELQELSRRLIQEVQRLEAQALGPPSSSFELIRSDFSLPSPSGEQLAPAGLKNLAGNLLSLVAPTKARVGLLQLGTTRLLLIPGEAVSPLAARWAREYSAELERSPSTTGGGELSSKRAPQFTRVLSLIDGYLGYLETPEALAASAGESRRSFFDQKTITSLESNLHSCLDQR